MIHNFGLRELTWETENDVGFRIQNVLRALQDIGQNLTRIFLKINFNSLTSLT